MIPPSHLERKLLRKDALFILGEFHGVASNPKIILDLVKILKITHVCFELETKWNTYFKSFDKGVFLDALNNERWILDSGLMTKRHIPCIEKLLNKGIRVSAVRKEGENWNENEKRTADFIRKIIHKNDRVLVVVGLLHARKKEFLLSGEKYIPMGLHLPQSTHIQIRYGNTVGYNFGKVILQDKRIHNSKGNVILTKSRSRYFDYDVITS